MASRQDIRKPREGLKTLVAQYTFIHFEPAVEEARQLRSQGTPEKEIRRHLERSHADFGERTRQKIYQISLGLTPHDDIRPEQVAKRVSPKESTVEIELKESSEDWQAGEVVYFEGRRWVLTAERGRLLSLKHF